jgi:NTE family protein
MPDTPKASTILPPGAVVGLALGSGGGRGLAHLGVLRYLAETGIRPAFVAGTSAGSIVGATCACGRTEELIDIAENADWRFMTKIFGEVGLHRSGLFTGRHVEKFFRTFLPATIEELQIPFAAVATDYRRTREVVIDKGDLIEAIRASISIPGVFTPVRRGGRYLVDGALVNPVPVSVVRKMGAKTVIGVDVNLAPGKGIADPLPRKAERHFQQSLRRLRNRLDELAEANPRTAAALESARELITQYQDAPTLVEVLLQTTRLAENEMTRSRLEADKPDILIQPAVGDVPTLDFTNAGDCIRAGYEAAKIAMSRLSGLNDH